MCMFKTIFKVFLVVMLIAALFGAFDFAASDPSQESPEATGYFDSIGVIHSVAAKLCNDGKPGC